jgi:hypothetical protein
MPHKLFSSLSLSPISLSLPLHPERPAGSITPKATAEVIQQEDASTHVTQEISSISSVRPQSSKHTPPPAQKAAVKRVRSR